MAHVKKFQGIPMSKSMRNLCKEEDYAFLGGSEKATEGRTEEAAAPEDDWRDRKEERNRRRLEREQQERERLREIEECKKEKERRWRSHVAETASGQEKALQDRLTRLRQFRAFQRKVLNEESGPDGAPDGDSVDRLLTRI
ncbi:stress response protein nst1 [Salarias fasciatus]|uniref:stress response protein nst1 n=1 Tax=Salarias fasciatus TaxID=181472 RepID=UPI0011769DE4|nr:stress response protein nst1-like [Salarias fasciatus]